MDDTRQQLIDTAGPLFAERGFRATTVREICEAARANQAAINYHFGDKENLYIECVRHAGVCCLERVPLPVWPVGTAPEQKLQDFIRMFLRRVAVDYEPAWHSQLIMRELAMPTQACVEFVRQFVRPTFDALQQVLRELVHGQLSDREIVLVGFSIVGQILHYRVVRPAITILVGDAFMKALDIDLLTDHITRFSLGAIEQLTAKTAAGEHA
jgi:TetR/AcrR family transcriptional regulator, regulator of cefoperazone and chloramphenicol sensitivity